MSMIMFLYIGLALNVPAGYWVAYFVYVICNLIKAFLWTIDN